MHMSKRTDLSSAARAQVQIHMSSHPIYALQSLFDSVRAFAANNKHPPFHQQLGGRWCCSEDSWPIRCLRYADDIVLMSSSHTQLASVLDI